MKTGDLKKMRTELSGQVQYYMDLGGEEILMNALMGKKIRMVYHQRIHCIRCGRETKKSFAQGYCYPCFISAPETEECVLRPEMCRAHEGIARDIEFARAHCLIEHVVYLSVTSNLKVGVTRNTQVPYRWIDQGATAAVELARTPNRFLAGMIEVSLKEHLKDKTNWRAMLKNQNDFNGDLLEWKYRVRELIPAAYKQYFSGADDLYTISYPVSSYPGKVSSINLDKEPEFEGVLTGIRGQYLMIDHERVINIRKYGGYYISLDY